MEFNINFENIFFDRFDLSYEEKMNEAKFVLTKAFHNFNHEIFMDEGRIVIEECSGERAIEIENIINLIKLEFFIILNKSEDKPNAEISTPMEKAEEYIKLNYLYEELTVGSICNHCGVKRNILDKMFVNKYGKTVSEYIRYMRVDAAKKQLEKGEKLQAVASLCGFGSVKTMQRAFKNICGKTPGFYRPTNLDTDRPE